MKVTQDLIQKYGDQDMDTIRFLKMFEGGEILAVDEADRLPTDWPPHLSILAKLRKADLVLSV